MWVGLWVLSVVVAFAAGYMVKRNNPATLKF